MAASSRAQRGPKGTHLGLPGATGGGHKEAPKGHQEPPERTLQKSAKRSEIKISTCSLFTRVLGHSPTRGSKGVLLFDATARPKPKIGAPLKFWREGIEDGRAFVLLKRHCCQKARNGSEPRLVKRGTGQLKQACPANPEADRRSGYQAYKRCYKGPR